MSIRLTFLLLLRRLRLWRWSWLHNFLLRLIFFLLPVRQARCRRHLLLLITHADHLLGSLLHIVVDHRQHIENDGLLALREHRLQVPEKHSASEPLGIEPPAKQNFSFVHATEN